MSTYGTIWILQIPYFFTAPDGGMVFKSHVNGGRTSSGTRFPRSELREYARAGLTNRADGADISVSRLNENNWVLGYQPNNLMLDDIGAVIIGQIHAEDDEPLRLYYRKLPQNEFGSVYLVHEINGGNDLEEKIFVGSRDDDASNPQNGIALDELFSYQINAECHNRGIRNRSYSSTR